MNPNQLLNQQLSDGDEGKWKVQQTTHSANLAATITVYDKNSNYMDSPYCIAYLPSNEVTSQSGKHTLHLQPSNPGVWRSRYKDEIGEREEIQQ